LLNGDAGFAHGSGAPLPAAVAGRGLKVLAAFQFSSFELYAHPDIKSLSQLKGKTITLTGSVLRPNLETALRRRGLSIEDVQIAPREATRRS